MVVNIPPSSSFYFTIHFNLMPYTAASTCVSSPWIDLAVLKPVTRLLRWLSTSTHAPKQLSTTKPQHLNLRIHFASPKIPSSASRPCHHMYAYCHLDGSQTSSLSTTHLYPASNNSQAPNENVRQEAVWPSDAPGACESYHFVACASCRQKNCGLLRD